jgi:lysozyme
MNGIDVSSHNGSINWSKVASTMVKIDFAYIKASEGIGYTDPKFLINASKAKMNNIRVGYYHFASLNTTNDIADAKAEADYFISVIKKAPPFDLPLVLDLETNKVGLDRIHVLEWINTFLNEMELSGYSDTALYSYTPFLDSNLPADHGLGSIRLWLAAYVNGTPKLPVGWKEYWIWQYTSKGQVSGINGNVDLNKTIKPLY